MYNKEKLFTAVRSPIFSPKSFHGGCCIPFKTTDLINVSVNNCAVLPKLHSFPQNLVSKCFQEKVTLMQ